MAEAFLSLSAGERNEALQVAASNSGRPPHLLEKDIWVVWSLAALFESKFAEHLVFKGGTSLSKAYQAIQRFSEDIDVTYDIRHLVPDLVRDASEALPPNRSQQKKWTEAIRTRLPEWIAREVLPIFQSRLDHSKAPARVRCENDCLYIEYERLADSYGYVKPAVMIEFGARSTGEPAEVRNVTCDATDHVPTLSFPTASPRVMRAERTFWEKATAIHVYCLQGELKGERFARHWYDLAQLDETGYAASALAVRDIAQAVARHKSCFFSEKDSSGNRVDYSAAVTGVLQLVPGGSALELLSADYAKMAEDGVLLDISPPFEEIIARCRVLQDRANRMSD